MNKRIYIFPMLLLLLFGATCDQNPAAPEAADETILYGRTADWPWFELDSVVFDRFPGLYKPATFIFTVTFVGDSGRPLVSRPDTLDDGTITADTARYFDASPTGGRFGEVATDTIWTNQFGFPRWLSIPLELGRSYTFGFPVQLVDTDTLFTNENSPIATEDIEQFLLDDVLYVGVSFRLNSDRWVPEMPRIYTRVDSPGVHLVGIDRAPFNYHAAIGWHSEMDISWVDHCLAQDCNHLVDQPHLPELPEPL